MADSGNGSLGRLPSERTSLFGLVTFRPRVAAVLAILTVTVGAVAFRMSRDTGTRRVEVLIREASRLFAAGQKEIPGPAPGDPAEIETRIRELTGAEILLPRDEESFVYGGVTQEKVGRRSAAVRLTFGEDRYLLLVVRGDTLPRTAAGAFRFFEPGFISGEKDGKSFVFWERDGISFVLVSDADLTRAFDLVRRYLT